MEGSLSVHVDIVSKFKNNTYQMLFCLFLFLFFFDILYIMNI